MIVLLGLNEVQFPKELRPADAEVTFRVPLASMKCSFRRNCYSRRRPASTRSSRLNEVQFPKELRLQGHDELLRALQASMKCSSRRNCDVEWPPLLAGPQGASMKCSSRRNCDDPTITAARATATPQ